MYEHRSSFLRMQARETEQKWPLKATLSPHAVGFGTFQNMPKTKFFVNTAMVCYNCCRTAVVRFHQSWREVTLMGFDTEVLDIVFVSCVTCRTLPHVHRPMSALFPKYIDPQRYQLVIHSLVDIFRCSPNIDQAYFSITALKIKSLTRIFDPLEIYNLPEIPKCYITVIENAAQSCHFFFGRDTMCGSPWASRQAVFALVTSRLPVQVTLADLWTRARTENVPPPYSAVGMEDGV